VFPRKYSKRKEGYLQWGNKLIVFPAVIALLFSCLSCQPSPDAKEEETGNTNTEKQLVLQQDLTAYDQPDGQPVIALKRGDKLLLTGEISQRLYPQTTRKDTLLEPFLKVILPNQELAWVYANPTNFNLVNKDVLAWQWHNRLSSIFNTTALLQYEQIWEQWNNTNQAGVLLLTFQAMRVLRDQLETSLQNYPLLPAHQYEGLFPASLSYQTGAGPGWWIDFNQWIDRCSQVAETEAEIAMFQFYQKEVYPPDGIEYHFHSWEFPVTRHQKHSLLGRNIHYKLLLELDQLTQEHAFLQAECLVIKNELVSDICTSGNTYWEEWPTIQNELDTILLKSTWNILNQEDLAAIKHRRQTLGRPNIQDLYLSKRNK
jgi:hypothetical protein